jgi:hypothetical protein
MWDRQRHLEGRAVMDRWESEKAAGEARQEVTNPKRPSRYSEAALRYLQQIGYVESHRREPRPAPKRDHQSSDEAG